MNKSNVKDLTGKRFGRLLVIERAKNSTNKKERHAMWLCKCDCGNEIITVGSILLMGTSKSCGCYAKEQRAKVNIRNLIGQKFGILTVIRENGRSRLRRVQWLCKCNCGNECNADSNGLIQGFKVSCGCLNQSLVASELKNYCVNKYNAIKEYNMFRNPSTGYPLHFDIFIKKYNMFIEVHGLQHYKFIPYFHKDQKDFEYNQHLDKIKKEYAQQNGIFIEIDLRKIKELDKVIKIIERKINKLEKSLQNGI